MGDNPGEHWLTTSQLSGRWQVPASTLYDWQRRRYGPRAVRFGRGERGQLRYRLSDVERWEREQEAAEAEIAALAASAPPLTPGQRARLAALLGVPGPETAAAGETTCQPEQKHGGYVARAVKQSGMSPRSRRAPARAKIDEAGVPGICGTGHPFCIYPLPHHGPAAVMKAP